MTELLINGTAVVLPAEFTTAVKVENPFFTKNGEYTYDITLNLDNKTNAELYKHLNRINSIAEIEEKRKAVLIADNRVYCNGTEVITGWTDDTVSIQIASGNSELNYVIGSDLSISTLSMKETTPRRGNLNYVEKRYPEIDYCLVPVFNRTTGVYFNKWALKDTGNDSKADYTIIPDNEDWYPQPYLCAYVRDLFSALGYSVALNQLENTAWKDLYICHTIKSCKWNEFLPGWSVNDFLEELEKLFNIILIVDNNKKSVKIMLSNSYYTIAKNVHVQQVEDVYEAEIEEQPKINSQMKSNMKYNFPDNAYYRWRCLPASLAAKRESIPLEFEGWLARIYSWFQDPAHKKIDTIYLDLRTGREYLFIKTYPEFLGAFLYYMVNEFQELKREDTEQTITLDIMPVEMGIQGAVNVYGHAGNVIFSEFPATIPTIDGEQDQGHVSESRPIPEQIGNPQNSESTPSKDKIFLAFYTGLKKDTLGIYGNNGYPQAYTDEYVQKNDESITLINSDGASLRLDAMNSNFYAGNYEIDLTCGIKTTSHDPNLYNAQNIFEIRNRRYVCKDMEFSIDAHGRKGAWIGTFYPIRISDIEADKRWVLTDGKWRDGGVWVDNGRWLDE